MRIAILNDTHLGVKNGADILVAGSAIFKSNDPIQTIAEMKKS